MSRLKQNIYNTETGGQKLGLKPVTMRQYHKNHNIGTHIGERMIIFTEEDLEQIRQIQKERWNKKGHK